MKTVKTLTNTTLTKNSTLLELDCWMNEQAELLQGQTLSSAIELTKASVQKLTDVRLALPIAVSIVDEIERRAWGPKRPKR